MNLPVSHLAVVTMQLMCSTKTDGGWESHNEIPADRGIYGSFNQLADSNKVSKRIEEDPRHLTRQCYFRKSYSEYSNPSRLTSLSWLHRLRRSTCTS